MKNKKSKVKSLKGLYQKFSKEAKNKPDKRYSPKELEIFINQIMQNLKKARVELKGWQGKSSFEVRVKEDVFEVITYRKPQKGSEPKENKTEIDRGDVNATLKAIDMAINRGYYGEKDGMRYVKTRHIATYYCKIKGIYESGHNEDLFKNGVFNWDAWFSDRNSHQYLNLIERLLDYYDIVEYKGGRCYLKNKVVEIQEAI